MREFSRLSPALRVPGAHQVLNEEQQLTVIDRINVGSSISAIAREFNTTLQTNPRVKAGQQSY